MVSYICRRTKLCAQAICMLVRKALSYAMLTKSRKLLVSPLVGVSRMSKHVAFAVLAGIAQWPCAPDAQGDHACLLLGLGSIIELTVSFPTLEARARVVHGSFSLVLYIKKAWF
jgi:hypothetical protein